MPPRRLSRHLFTIGFRDDSERLLLTDRERFFYVARSDNRQHVVRQGDTLFNLAQAYFKPMPRPDGLWWVIADFQPTPVHDPTLRLTPGRLLVIPSLRTVLEEVFNESRRQEET